MGGTIAKYEPRRNYLHSRAINRLSIKVSDGRGHSNLRTTLKHSCGEIDESNIEYPILRKSGCGSAWLERCVRDAEVAGSNPVTPTRNQISSSRLFVASCFSLDLKRLVLPSWRSLQVQTVLQVPQTLSRIFHKSWVRHSSGRETKLQVDA